MDGDADRIEASLVRGKGRVVQQEIAALKPDVPSFGYAAVLSMNATSIWGGIYPYLDPSCQTELVTIGFYIVQILAFALTFACWMGLAWMRPAVACRNSVVPCAAPLAAGPLMLVAAMYIPALSLFLIFAGSALIGFALAGFMVRWQRVFAAMDASRGNLTLVKGTLGSALLYLALCMVPQALTAYLLPLVLVPLAALCLWLAGRSIALDQPMFQDVPRDHDLVYRNAFRESISPALAVGALGFAAGAIRFIAITHQDLLSAINIVSMVALFVVVACFYLLWRHRALRMSMAAIFLALFPLVAICLMVMPFAGSAFVDLGFGIANGCFMLACMFMMMHCGQLSRDSGINPVVIYGFYGAIAYVPQIPGYLVGYASGIETHWGVEQFSFVALASLFVLLLAALFGLRVPQQGAATASGRAGGTLEFLTLKGALGAAVGEEAGGSESGQLTTPRRRRGRAGTAAQSLVHEVPLRAVGLSEEAREPDGAEAPREAETPLAAMAGSTAASEESASGAEGSFAEGMRARDALTLRCQRVSQDYGLSSREAEVMELIARGYTGPAIAEMLFISENTMRTHNKRIYAKLEIHKKQELLELIESYDARY